MRECTALLRFNDDDGDDEDDDEDDGGDDDDLCSYSQSHHETC